MAVLASPTYQLQPSAQQVALSSNYITNAQFNFLNQYLPDTYEKEFERYGNRTVSSFLRMVGAEMPSNSDLIKWAEQGRLHIKYVNCTLGGAGAGAASETFTVPAAQIEPARQPSGSVAPAGAAGQIGIRKGQTVMISDDTAGSALNNKGIVTAVTATTFTVAMYEAAGLAAYAGTVSVFIYGSEFKKGVNGMEGGLISNDFIFENSPIILKDKYQVSGSDMAQIGWIEVQTEDGASGYLWYLKSEHETRLRFDDYLETAMVEAVPAEAGSGVATQAVYADAGNKGSEGVFYVVEARGNVWGAGNPSDLAGFDSIISRLDKQGSIEENVIFKQNIRIEAEKRSIDPDRIIFAKKIPLDEHLARHKLADLFLDTFVYNAHSTATEALWLGLPVVTKIGKSFASRVAASLLTSLDMKELITYTEEEYESLICDFAEKRKY
mgnify:CR=1 FL=1